MTLPFHYCALTSVALALAAGGGAWAQGAGLDVYAQGLQQITVGQYADAAASLQKAIEAQDEDANRHLGRAIALMLARQGASARPHLDRARRLEPRHAAVPVWNYFYLWTYAPPLRSIPEVPHSSSEPYAKDLINATTQYKNMQEARQTTLAEQAWKQVEQCAAKWAWSQLARPELLQAQSSDLDALCARKQYDKCLAIVSRLLEANPTDARLLSISAESKLALKDDRGARTHYTLALKLDPTRAAWLRGRGLAAAHMGGLRTAEADRAVAAELDPKSAKENRGELDNAIESARGRRPTEAPAALLAALQKAAQTEPVDKLGEAAERLVRADIAERLVSDEAYTQELAHLQHAFDRDSGNVEKAVALAAFCIRPAVEIPVPRTSEKRRARVRVGAPDLDRARRALDVAGKLAPQHHGALTQQALWMQAKDNKKRMIQTVERAMELGALNYDLAKMYLDFYQELASSQEQEAAGLRVPTITYENRPDGRYRVTTPPSAAALARAAQLEAQAKENRRKSMQPLQKLAAAQPKTPFGKLAEAEVQRMIGQYDRMAQTADAALQIDPWHLEAREYLIEHCPKVGMNERALHHQDILNNLFGPSARITIGPVLNLLDQTRYTSALQTIEAGQTKEPASGRVATLRAITLGQAGKTAEAEPAYRVAAAMALARLGLLSPSADAPWPAEDAALALAIHRAWAHTLEATEAAEAWRRLDTLLRVAAHVPKDQWRRDLPATQLPTVFKHQNDKRRTGMNVGELVVEAQMTGAKLLASLDRLEEAARLLVACKETSESMPWKPPVDAAAYPIIQKMGEARAAQIFPPLMMEGYRVMGRFGRHQETFRGTETVGKEGVRQQWIEARLKEIDQDLQLVQRSQTLTAMRKREQLTQERQQLVAELDQLRSQPGPKR